MSTYTKPLQIVALSPEFPYRIGGPAPNVKENVESDLAFFFSIPHPELPDHGVSVFISRDFDDQWDNRGLLMVGPPVLQVITHPLAGVRPDDSNRSELSEHSLAIGKPEIDYVDIERVWCHHKIQGFSSLEIAEAISEETVNQIEKSGYEFWGQIAFPDANDDDVDGNWPVGDCLFALYYQPSTSSFAAVWEKL